MIQGDELPPIGTDIRISRGSLVATGRVMWVAGNKSGLSFSRKIDVSAWLTSCSTRAHQDRADDALAAIRDGSAEAGEPPAAPGGPSSITARRQTIDQLTHVHDLLQKSVEQLAADQHVLLAHRERLQILEAAARMIAELIQKSQ